MNIVKEFIEFSQAVSSFVMVILTAVYVYCTWKIVDANRKMVAAGQANIEESRKVSWQTSRAFVVPRLLLRDFLFWLEISNSGKSSAENVNLRFDRDVYQMGCSDRRINEMPLFSKTIATIPPGASYYVILWAGGDKPGSNLVPNELTIIADYQSLCRPIHEETILDVKIYEGQDYPPRSVEEHLKKLTQATDKIAVATGKLTR
jgi:hypothetical protein